MNRELKFRAWHTEQKRMFEVYGLGSDFVTENTFDGVDYGTNAFCGDDMNFIEIMQYTGLKDKNGVEIYEGDICAYSRYSNWQQHNVDGSDSRMIGLVRFGVRGDYSIPGSDFHASAFYLQLINDSKYSSSIYHRAEDIYLNQTNNTWGLEVIGNMFQNPELSTK